MADLRASDLSVERRRLLSLMRVVRFGELRDLRVVKGEPVFDPAPIVVREVRLGAHESHVPLPADGEYALRNQVLELFRELTILANGLVESIEIRHGLPYRLRLRGRAEPEARKTSAGGGR